MANLTAGDIRAAARNAYNPLERANSARARADVGNVSVIASRKRTTYWVGEIRVSLGAFEDHLARQPVPCPDVIHVRTYYQQ